VKNKRSAKHHYTQICHVLHLFLFPSKISDIIISCIVYLWLASLRFISSSKRITKKKKKLLYFEKILIKYSMISRLSFLFLTLPLRSRPWMVFCMEVRSLLEARPASSSSFLPASTPFLSSSEFQNHLTLYAVPYFIFKGTLSRNLWEDLC